jgi:hypothetical protein
MFSTGFHIDEPAQSHRSSTHHDYSRADLTFSDLDEEPNYHEDTSHPPTTGALSI